MTGAAAKLSARLKITNAIASCVNVDGAASVGAALNA